MGKDLTEIAMALVSVAVIALLVGHSSDTAKIIDSGTKGFAGLLSVVTLQNGYSNVFSG